MALTKISTGMLKQDAASSDLNIDAGTLYLDVSNNRVGIADTSPSQTLDVAGTAVFGAGTTRLTTYSDSGYSGIYNGSSLTSDESIYMGGGNTFFYTDNAERMRLNSTGLGIGVSNPGAKLHVVGPGRFDNSASTSVRLHINNSGSNDYASIYADTASAYKNLIINPNGGNVGIGTASPSRKLTVYDASAPYLALQNSSTGIAAGDGFQIQMAGLHGYVFNYESGDLYLGAGGATRITVKSDGSVGIGTSSPGDPLHVQFSNNTGADTGIIVKNTNTGTTSNFAGVSTQAVNGSVTGTFSSADYDAWGVGTFAGSQSNHPTYLIANNAVKMIIDTSGNVGIGETVPLGKLHVKLQDTGATANAVGNLLVLEGTENGISLLSSTAGAGYILFGDSDDNAHGGILYDHSTGAMRFRTGSTWDQMKILSNGNVGIGTASPGAPLNVTSAYSAGNETTALKIATVGGYNSTSGTAIDFGNDQGNYATWLTGRIGSRKDGGSWKGALTFSTNDDGSATDLEERMRIDGDGNVGIGTTSPATQLQVAGTGILTLGISGINGTITSPHSLILKSVGSGEVLRYYQGSTEVFGVYTSGKVGIGTDTPTKQLTVSGADAEFLLSRTGSYADTINMGMPSGVPTIVGGTDLAFGGSGTWTEHMRIDSGGRLGINQTPLANNFALQVTGLGGGSNDARAVYLKGSGNHTSIGGTGPTLALQNTNTTANNIVKLSFESASSGETVSINAINTNHTSHYGDMAFNTRGSSGYSEKMRIMANGNVGIGTASPGSKFTVDTAPNGNVPVAHIKQTGATNAPTLLIEQTGNGGNNNVNQGLVVRVDGQNSGLGNIIRAIGTNSNLGGDIEAFIVKGSGNVGIGTSSPDADLHISGTNDSNLIIQNSTYQGSGQNTEAAIRFKVTASSDAERAKAGIHFKNDGSAYGRGDLHFAVDSADDNGNVDINDSKMVITHEGNVGIGTDNPGYKLTVNGDFQSLGMYSYGSTILGANTNGRTDQTTVGGFGVLAGDGSRYGNYGSIAFRSSSNYTGSSRAYLITNGYGANKFAIIQGSDANTIPDISGVGGGANNGTPRFVIDSSGKVGIGTTSPANTLDLGAATLGGALTFAKYSNVFSEYSNGSLWLASNFYGNAGASGYKAGTTGNFGAAGVRVHGTGGGSNSGIIQFYADANASKTADDAFTPTERVRINNSGSAGAATLQVFNSRSDSFNHVQENLVAGLTDGETVYLGIGKTNATKNTGYLGYTWASDASNNNYIHLSHWGANSLFRVYGNGDYSFAGSNVSDRDKKENIKEVSGTSLDKITQIPIKSFKMKATLKEGNEVRHQKTGFIAQEVQSHLPDVVTGTDGKGDMGIDTTGLIAHLVRAVKEQQVIIDDLKIEIQQLRQRVAQLEE